MNGIDSINELLEFTSLAIETPFTGQSNDRYAPYIEKAYAKQNGVLRHKINGYVVNEQNINNTMKNKYKIIGPFNSENVKLESVID